MTEPNQNRTSEVPANTTVAFIGLGIMGAPMAGHLLDAGYQVIGYNRSRRAVDRLVAKGAKAAATAAEAVRGADVVITMVPDSPDVEEITVGEDGFYAVAKPGLLHIDCSTIRPDVARKIAEAGADKGIRVVDAPVSGGEAGAVEGTLSIMVGGAPDDVEAAMPYLNVVGKTIVHVGPAGSGQTVKAANQLIVAGNIQLVAEALVFLEAHGVDTEAATEVLAGGLAGSAVLNRKAANMRAREFTPGFRVDLHHKDLGIVTAAAREAGVAIPLGAAVAQLVGALRAQGHGGLDHSALLLLVEQLSGRTSKPGTG
jgi:2-hydroxy-3-oxopropionate reductase